MSSCWFHYEIPFWQSVVDQHDLWRGTTSIYVFLNFSLIYSQLVPSLKTIRNSRERRLMDRQETMLRLIFYLTASKGRAYIGCLPHTYILDNILYYLPHFLNWIWDFRHFSKGSRIDIFYRSSWNIDEVRLQLIRE